MKKTSVDFKHSLLIFSLLVVMAVDLHANEDEMPSMEFLEFLGEWETQDGEWFDPVKFLDEQKRDAATTEESKADD